MTMVISATRNTVKGLIVSDNKILVNKNVNSVGSIYYGIDKDAIYFDLPGGGQNKYETLENAVIRECFEETGYCVMPDKLLCVFEEIFTNTQYRNLHDKYSHRVYFIYKCHLFSSQQYVPTDRDSDIVSSNWINIDDIEKIPFFPHHLRRNLRDILKEDAFRYLGTFFQK